MDGQSNGGQSDGIDGVGAVVAWRVCARASGGVFDVTRLAARGQGVKNGREGIPNQVWVHARVGAAGRGAVI